MTQMTCDFPNRDEALIACLYDDQETTERRAFDAHLAGCEVCRAELWELRGVRRHLSRWDTPAAARLTSPVSVPATVADPRGTNSGSWWRDVPVWARAAAAVLCIGAAAGLANVTVRHDDGGWSLTTGWMAPAPAASGPRLQTPAADAAPSRAALAALASEVAQLRDAQSALSEQTAALAERSEPAASQADTLRRVRLLVEESERRQERELALRVGQVLRDVSAQRQADLRRIDDKVGVIQSNTGAEVMRQRQLLQNYANYLSRVSLQK